MELIRFLAEVLELKKSHVSLDKVFVKTQIPVVLPVNVKTPRLQAFKG